MKRKTANANPVKRRNIVVLSLAMRSGAGAGRHQNRVRSVARGHSRKVKHKQRS